MADAREALLEEVAEAADAPVDPRVDAAVAALLARCEAGRVRAVLFYGSALWNGVESDSVLDLYLLVDELRAAGQGRVAAALNRLLPPNVIYFETGAEPLRAKCAVMAWDQFARGARGGGVTPLVWGRFAQPCRIVYARDDDARRAVHAALADAVATFHARVLPLLPARLPVSEVWCRGLAESYARELRPEGAARPAELWRALGPDLAQRTWRALPHLPFAAAPDGVDGVAVDIAPARRTRARLAAGLARPVGKALALLRVIKAAFTFEGGVDYVCWKIARHSGVVIEPTPFQRRHPLLAGWPLLWRVIRRGGLR